jgi:outer membrane protein assembly factor BamB
MPRSVGSPQWRTWFACSTVLLAVVPPLHGQVQDNPSLAPPEAVYIPGVGRELAGRMNTADRLIADGDIRAGVDEYLTILREHGDDLVPISAALEPLTKSQRFGRARWLVQERIIGHGPLACKAARGRMHELAKKWLENGIAQRDQRLLRRVVEDALFTAPAVQALELLGDYCFERGDFATAQHWWRLLAQPKSEAVGAVGLKCPEVPETVRLRALCKQIVALLFLEQTGQAQDECNAFRREHPSAFGQLAGRSGNLGGILQSLIDARHGQVSAAEQQWPTFAGDAARNRSLPLGLSPKVWADGPSWRVRLDTGRPAGGSEVDRLPHPAGSQGAAYCFPVIARGLAFVADHRTIRGFDLERGTVAIQFDLLDLAKGHLGAAEKATAVAAGFRSAVAVEDGFLVARLGAMSFGPTAQAGPSEGASTLVCIRLPDERFKEPAWRAKPLWAAVAPRGETAPAFFEGCPIVHDGAVYIAQSRLQGFRAVTAIHCYDLATGRPRWQQDVCDAPEFVDDGPPRFRQHFLTLAGPNVVFASHAGAVAAVDCDTGKRAWAVRYASRGALPRAEGDGEEELRPPLAAGRCIMVAPLDANGLFCLDASSGKTLWHRDEVDAVHLLGVHRDLLVFATPRGLRAVSAVTGEDDSGWRAPILGHLPPAGRGLLAGGLVLFPTKDPKLPWRALDARTGQAPAGKGTFDPVSLRTLPRGNAAVGHGCLVICSTEELWGFTPPRLPAAAVRD